MPFDSQGNFTRVMNWQEDAANSIPILASRHDDEDDNFANGFNEVMCRDGRTQMTGQLKMGSNKIVGVATGTADTDAVNKGQLDSAVANVSTSVSSIITTTLNNTLKSLYPVGSIYIGTQSTCPLATLISGSTWTKVAEDKVLQTSSSSHSANSTINAGLPNITGTFGPVATGGFTATGAFYNQGTARGTIKEDGSADYTVGFQASRSSSIYGGSSTVQPPAYVVNVWRRTK